MRPSFLGNTAIVGVGMTEFSRESGRSVLDLATTACRAALDDAGLPAAELDGICNFSLHNDSVSSQAVAHALGLPELRWGADINGGGASSCLLAMQAAMAVDAGVANAAIVFRALNGRSGSRIGRERDRGAAAQYRQPIGLTAWPQYQAMWARRFMIETGATERDLGAVAVTQRRWAMLNERAMFREPLTLEEYFESPWLVEPFRYLDCTTEVDGGCALVITSLERARSLRHVPVVIEGAGFAAGPRPGIDLADLFGWDDYSRNYLSLLAGPLWESAGLRPEEVDMAQIYDCFTHTVLFALEGLGLAERGMAGEVVASGATGPGGRLPVNTHGGLLCEGYLHGINTLAEGVVQLQGKAGDRQVADSRTSVVTSGSITAGSALILASEGTA